jgi:hypothetical protein
MTLAFRDDKMATHKDRRVIWRLDTQFDSGGAEAVANLNDVRAAARQRRESLERIDAIRRSARS